MARIRADYVFGTTDVALAAADTTLSSPELTRLPAVASPDVAAVVLTNSTTGAYEIVHITAHAASATTATIERGREGSTAQVWTSGASWFHGPTATDITGRTPLADLLAAKGLLIAAHRGDIGSDDSYPENSLEAVRQAALKGAHAVEVDLIQSADGTYWLSHDTTVDRVTSGTGTVSAMTDAALGALVYDAGYGYNAGRHGSTIGLTTLGEVFTALAPYSTILAAQLYGGDATTLAQYVIDAGWGSRVILEVSTLAEAAAIKAVDPALAVMAHATNVAGSTTDLNVDWLSEDIDALTSLATVTSYAPRAVKAYTSIADYGTDEATRYANAEDYGARMFQANDLDQALALYRASSTGGISGTIQATRVTSSAATSFTHGTGATIPWATEDYDDLAAHDVATNNDRFTITTTGRYRLTVAYGVATAKVCFLSIRKNGTATTVAYELLSSDGVTADGQCVGHVTSGIMDLVAGDYLVAYLTIYKAAGSGTTTRGSTPAFAVLEKC